MGMRVTWRSKLYGEKSTVLRALLFHIEHSTIDCIDEN